MSDPTKLPTGPFNLPPGVSLSDIEGGNHQNPICERCGEEELLSDEERRVGLCEQCMKEEDL